MKKLLLALAVSAVAAFSAQAADELVIGTEGAYPPFNFIVASGKVGGFDVDIGLALCAIPILIHILNRRRFKVVEWAAMRYLLEAMRSNRRRLRFESLLLLAARCAVLFLLAMAIARPLGCADSSIAAFAGQKIGLHVIVVDDSYSMAYEAGRPDAVLLPDVESLGVKALQQGRQLTRDALVDAKLVDNVCPPAMLGAIFGRVGAQHKG